MFEKAVIRGAGVDYHVDLGLVAETLLFYGSTHLVLDFGSVGTLLRKLGTDGLATLLERPEIKASYAPENFGVADSGGILSTHFPCTVCCHANAPTFKPVTTLKIRPQKGER